MIRVHVEEPIEKTLSLYRAAISEKNDEMRKIALENLQEQIDVWKMSALANLPYTQAGIISFEHEFLKDQFKGELKRSRAVVDFQDVLRRYDSSHSFQLRTAEEVALAIWNSIRQGRNTGVHSQTGLLDAISHEFRKSGIRGGRDKDVLARNWKTYRGVAHLGAAQKFCELNSFSSRTALELAEEIRFALSNENPKGTKQPYVSEAIQYSFIEKSMW